MTLSGLAGRIDHTLLAPTARARDIVRLCAEAREHGFACVCVQPSRVALVAQESAGAVVVCSVIGFPLGASLPTVKLREAELAVAQGAGELDMVMNLGALLDGDHDLVRGEIAAISALGVPLKVILETAVLGDATKQTACRLAVEGGAAFVKTSTGFGPGGASEADVALLRRTVGPPSGGVGVKASGGIRTLDQALAMLRAGADRIGASSGVAIMAQAAEVVRRTGSLTLE